MAIKASDNFKVYHNENGPDITTVTRPIMEADGLYFKDIDGTVPPSMTGGFPPKSAPLPM